MLLLLKVLVAVTLLCTRLQQWVAANHTDEDVDQHTMTSCLRRSYVFNVTGRYCWEMLEVDACWGRCDSWELGIPSPPYVELHHPVCTYSGRLRRQVELTNCAPGRRREREILFDALDCSCRTCRDANAQCELY